MKDAMVLQARRNRQNAERVRAERDRERVAASILLCGIAHALPRQVPALEALMQPGPAAAPVLYAQY